MNAAQAAQAAAQRERLLALLLEREGFTAPPAQVIQPVDRGGGVPPSFGQQRMWVMDRLAPGLPLYNAPLAYRVRGAVDLAALRAAFQAVVDRHEALRTTLTTHAGTVVQVIAPPSRFPLEVVRLDSGPDHPKGDMAAAVAELARAEAMRPFDLEHDRPIRAKALVLGKDDHVLLITLHHVATDSWSLAVLFHELSAAYEQALRGGRPGLPELAVQYADYAGWQRRRLSGDRLRRELEHWTGRLRDAPRILTVPADRPRPGRPTFAGAEHSFRLPAETVERLRAIAAAHDATLFMVLLAAFKVLLARYTAETDIVVGTPVAGRDRVELEPLIGFFVNDLVLRTGLAADPSFTEVLRRVRRTVLDAQDHRELAFEKLVEELRPARQLSVHPLFQVGFQVEQRHHLEGAGDLRLCGAHAERIVTTSGTSKFDVSLALVESAGVLTGTFEYARDLYDAATIERLAANFQTLIGSAIADPDRPMSRLPLLAGAERRRVIEEWNDTARPPGRDAGLHRLFQAKARRTPDAVAVIAEGERIGYRQLDEWSNALAHRLRSLGVRPETIVAVCAERTVEAVVALLGVLKAGGAYLPIAPDQPMERSLAMLADARAAVLCTHEGLLESFAGLDIPRCSLQGDWRETYPTTALDELSEAGNAAYAIFTSGSTGRPKCAVIPHAGVVNYLRWLQARFRLTAGDRVLHKAPLGFDVSVWEIFWPLSSGAAVVLARPDGQRDPAYLAGLVQDEQVTVMHFVPVMLRAFLAEPAAAACTSLRTVLCGGEAITPDLVARFHHVLDAELHNQYGPTETTVQTTASQLRPGSGRIALGKGIWNTRHYVLDAMAEPVPQGAAGELYIAGVMVGRGYLGLPALTAERFLPDPFGEPGTRMYRTGDLVRWLPDGTLEFLGRTDHQVKIRGFRVEPGETEAQLKAHPAVRAAAVAARPGPGGEMRLVGYFVPRKPQSAGTDLGATLRRHLSERLPAYLVPAALVPMDALPTNANGKVDLAALPEPAAPPARPRLAGAGPRTRAEIVLGRIWASVLRVGEPGTHDNFFTLGGDSIQAIEVSTKAAAAGLTFTPNQVFQHQTLAELAAVATRDGPPGPAPECPAPEQGAVTGAVALTPIQRGYLAAGSPEPAQLAQYAGLIVAADVDPAVLDTALDQLIRHHDMLRARFERQGTGWAQTIDPHRPAKRLDRLAVHSGDVDDLLDQQAARLCAELDPVGGRILRAVLMERPGAPAVLLIVIHHLCVDAVSWRILTEDLEAAYRRLAAGDRDPGLPAKTTSFQCWARLLHELAASPEMAEESRLWRRLLPEPAPSPPEQPHQRGETGRMDRLLSRTVTRTLLEEAPEAYLAQINDLLLTALAVAHHRVSGAPGLVADLEGHGREPLFPEADLTRTVGWFTSIHPVPLFLDEPSDLQACLLSVKETLRSVPRHGIGFGLLQLRDDEHARRAVPAAEILVNYLGQTIPASPGALFEPMAEPLRLAAASGSGPSHPIELVAQIVHGRLAVRWLYLQASREPESMAALADEFAVVLEEIAELARRPGAGARSAADFPLSGLSTREIERYFGTARDIEDIYPLTAVQEGILFHTLTAPAESLYLAQVSWELGDVDGETMAEAWRELARRYPALRTRIVWEVLDRPLQVVERACRLPVETLDWSGLLPPEQRDALEELLRGGRRRGIDLRTAPPARITLIRTGPAGLRILLEYHHILLDGWSTVMLVDDLLAVHAAMESGDDLQLPERRPFREYIVWAEGKKGADEEAYWRAVLAGFDEPTPLPPGGSPEPAAGEPGLSELDLDEELAGAMHDFARRTQVTAYTLVEAAWGLLLALHAGVTDVVFGATVSGRNGVPGAEQMLGLFINTLPVRVKITGDRPVEEWLRDQQAARAAMPSEHTALTRIARWSQVPPRTPLFATNITFGNYPLQNPVRRVLGGLSSKVLRVAESSHYPLGLVVNPGPPFEAQVLYDRSRFHPSAAAGLAADLTRILADLVSGRAASALELITRAGRIDHRAPQKEHSR